MHIVPHWQPQSALYSCSMPLYIRCNIVLIVCVWSERVHGHSDGGRPSGPLLLKRPHGICRSFVFCALASTEAVTGAGMQSQEVTQE